MLTDFQNSFSAGQPVKFSTKHYIVVVRAKPRMWPKSQNDFFP